MKIIQSFWSKPFFKENDDLNARFKGGWLSANFFFYSCLLSCLKFKQNYGEVSLYTDDLGKELLLDKLEIPYSKVFLDLNSLQNYPAELWALGKILTYSLQETPFIHADTDVFVWDKFPEQFLKADLLAQNFEYNFPKYAAVLEVALQEFQNFSKDSFPLYSQTKDVFAFNAGIIGGNNTSFFKEFKTKVFQIIDDNRNTLSRIDLGPFNMVYEQMLGFEMAHEQQIEVSFLRSKMNESFSNVMKFHLVPIKENYIHTVGYAKKTIEMCEQLKYRLKYEFPLEYEKLNQNLIKHDLSTEEEILDDERRFGFLSKIYEWLEKSTWEAVLETPFQLSETTRLHEISEDEIEIYFYSPQNKTEQKLEMEDWDFLLLFFNEPNTVNQIIDEIAKDETFMQNITLEDLTEKVFSFMMDRCMYHEILLSLNIV
jgi:hypothetical protein